MTARAPDAAQARFSAVLLADLADWSVQLHARSFTRVSVEMLLRDLRRSVPSALGYTLALGDAADLARVTITVADEKLLPAQVGSTITFALPVVQGTSATATFYAAEQQAFDELAVLLAGSPACGPDRVRLDGAPATDVEPGVDGLADHTRINYAIGILLARGLSYEESQRYLHRLADHFQTLEAAADHLLTGVGD
ncbi:hypothetical protein [Microlunatus antarcticus]|uniref:Uncharacterized protein n=1 Tax=Microlunatus antarcticus TaxID=53388 RepID=A0A7W5JVR7_9ACTN|nr:hypothetical protein [Microlunatus antarcticus]MBB3326657.1 hypothetical protein [Microlunatus antarcticus]